MQMVSDIFIKKVNAKASGYDFCDTHALIDVTTRQRSFRILANNEGLGQSVHPHNLVRAM